MDIFIIEQFFNALIVILNFFQEIFVKNVGKESVGVNKMRGIIWCNKQEDGIKRLKKLIQDYERRNIHTIRVKFTNNPYAYFDNNDIWKVVRANDCGRGEACNVSLISSNIEQKIIDCIIKPATKSLPYQAIGFYS